MFNNKIMNKLMKRILVMIIITFIFLFQSNISFAERRGPIIKDLQIGMPTSEALKICKKIQQDIDYSIVGVISHDDTVVDSVYLLYRAFSRTPLPVKGFIEKFENNYGIKLDQRESYTYGVKYKKIDKEKGYIVTVTSVGDKLEEIRLEKTSTYEEDKRRKEENEQRIKKDMENLFK